MNYKIIITHKADTDEASIYQYISEEFGEIYAGRFREKLIQLFSQLSKQPFIGRPAKNNSKFRVYIFSKQNKIIYTVSEEHIVIIRVLNTKTKFSSNF